MAPSAPLPRPVRARVVALTVALAAVVAGLLPGANAYAAPSPAQIEQQINTLWTQSEIAIEAYNSVHAKLQANQAKLAQLQAQIDPLQMQVQLAYTQVGAMSAQLYMQGPASKLNALLTAGSPSAFADQLTTLDQMAKRQQDAVAGAKAQASAYDTQRKPLDALVNQLKQQDADLAARTKAINAQLAELQKLRIQAYGASGGAGGVLKPVVCPVVYVGGAAGKAVAYACAHIGAPYVWAASGPNSFDCSGLTMAAWASAGVSLYHNAAVQRTEVKSVSAANLQPGDLVFFGSPPHHVALYIGGGWMLHAPHSGDHVREAKIADFGESPSGYGRP